MLCQVLHRRSRCFALRPCNAGPQAELRVLTDVVQLLSLFSFQTFFLKKADEEWPQKWNRKKTKGANNVRARLRGGEYFIVSCLHIIDQGAFLLLLLLPIFGGGGGGEYLSPIRKIGREALQ